MTTSDKLDLLVGDLIAVQARLRPAKRNVIDDNGKPYADIASAWSACRYLLAKHGLAVVQFGGFDSVTTVLLHSSGQYLAETTKTDTRANGEVLYGPRYALMLALGIVQAPLPKPKRAMLAADVIEQNRKRHGQAGAL
jgi:hypothetical protein